MLTDSTETSTGASFTKAVKDDAFNKVFHNNMDKNSFNDDIDGQIELMISNSKTAYYRGHDAILFQKEYKNCLVCK